MTPSTAGPGMTRRPSKRSVARPRALMNTKGPRDEGPWPCRSAESALREASDSVDDVARARLEAVRAMLHAAPDVPRLPLDRASVPAERGRASPLEAVEPAAEGVAI